MEPNDTPSGGLLNSFRRLCGSILALVHNRLDLAAIEWQEEKVRLISLLLLAVAAAVLGTLTLLMALAVVIYCLWQVSPWLALGLPTILFGLAAAIIFGNLKRRLKTGPRPFAETIAAFKKDAEWMRKKN